MSSNANNVTLEKIISLCKRRGFIYQSAEIYGGLNGVYDVGPLGTLMKQNIRKAWTNSLKKLDLDILFIEGALLAPEEVWKASGHVDNFQDPMIDCLNCKHRYRADDIDISKGCPHCGSKNWTEVRQFNLMFKTNIGASQETGSIAYLRPETAQSIYINFKNVMSSNRVKIPFGIAQIGKAFRNEITPKQFIFRMREFEQMELEWFCKHESAAEFFSFWNNQRFEFYRTIGVDTSKLRIRAHEQDELAHYSKNTSDIEYNFPFGWKELEGIANRGNFDLTQHSKHSGKDLAVYDEETKTSYIPDVVETSVGTDRLFLTLLFDAYQEEKIDDEIRTVLRLSSLIAPVTVAIMPLSNKLADKAKQLYFDLKKKGYSVQFDDGGSIGKRYRRQDEIGTPICITYDFESETDNKVTLRDRDSMKQIRLEISGIEEYIKNLITQI